MGNTEICTTPEQLKGLGPFWDGLQTFLDAPFGKHRWVLSCAEAFAADSELYVPVVRKDRVPVATAPLVKRRGFLGVVRQLGVEDHGEPGDFNYQDLESLDGLAMTLAERKVPLFLARVPEDSPVGGALRRAYRGRGLVILRPQVNCPFIEIGVTESQTLDNLPARLRSDLRRGRRKAETIGAISLEVHAPSTVSDLTPLWEESLRIEATGWKGRRHTALQLDHRVGSFYRAYAVRACEQGVLRIFFLRIGGKMTAMMIGLEVSERLWILKIGYDENFAACSPGMILIHEILRYAAQRKLKSYEFLGTATAWTRRWTKQERKILRIYVYPYTGKGAAILARDSVKYLWHKAYRPRKGR
ncbi:MAG: GNAT family N-acetyltransferase [Pseudomonadota bacterium]